MSLRKTFSSGRDCNRLQSVRMSFLRAVSDPSQRGNTSSHKLPAKHRV